MAPQDRRSYCHNPIDSSRRLVFLYRSRTAVCRSELARRTSVLRHIPARRISFARVFQRADVSGSVSFRLSPLSRSDPEGENRRIRGIFRRDRKLQFPAAAGILLLHVCSIFLGSLRISLSASRWSVGTAHPHDLLGQSPRRVCLGFGTYWNLHRYGRLPPVHRSG